ncbi:MAG TPA: MBL fold metallo-hydrolase [Ktedonobacterales bacterium]|nr:MBL fold metallo-hydrolase [Ktedonobacterales bacterium]
MQDISPTEASVLPIESFDPQELEYGVWRIPVPVPFGARATNLYLLRSGSSERWCLIDCPLRTAHAEATFRAGLAAAGVAPEQIGSIVITHTHPDHVGGAGYWQRETGASIYLLALQMRSLPALWHDPSNSAFLAAARELAAHGMNAEEAQTLVTRAVQIRSALEVAVHPTLLAHEQSIHLTGATYRVLWTPGHDDGHLCLLRDDGLFVAGDAVLSGIRPTIGWYPWSRPDPLRDQFTSLATLGALPVRLALPGHGRHFTDLKSRTDELAGIYARELVITARILADTDGGLDAYTLAHQLYEDRWRSRESQLLAIAESVARLEHLRFLGRAERTIGSDGAIIYHRTREDSALPIIASE